LLAGLVLWNTAHAQTNAPAEPAAPLADSYRQLVQQQQATLDALEQAREDAKAADARLRQLDDALAAQRQRELDALQDSHRFNLLVVGIFASVAVAGMAVVVLFLLRYAGKQNERPVVQPAPSWPVAPGSQLMTLDPAQQSNARFLGTMERLEKRLDEIESTLTPTPSSQPLHPAARSTVLPFEQPVAVDTRVALLIGKGRALLNLQQPAEALACFEEAAALDPGNAEAFIKKGMALEKLSRWNDAINAYDQAIDADSSDTLAYLYKGGVLSRLEHFDAALECYEQALSMQNRSKSAISG
jgi:tetratricopeptide (TPR) repeat protein